MDAEQDLVAEIPAWDVADRMRKALRHAGVGVGEMADYLDVGRNTVSTWINGRIRPSTQTLRLWAFRCGVPFEWLVTGAESVTAAYDWLTFGADPSALGRAKGPASTVAPLVTALRLAA